MQSDLFYPEDADQGIANSDFSLAAVVAVNQDHSAVQLLLDGTSTPTQKFYKALTSAFPLDQGNRVVVMKMSGTYVVVGRIGAESPSPTPTFIAPPNTVFAGPASGDSSDEATFRALTAADIPGGGNETVIVSNIFTPVTYITAVESKIAISGKSAHFHLNVQYGRNTQKETNSTNVYKIGTISEGYRPATEITNTVAVEESRHYNSGTVERVTFGSSAITITESGVVFVSDTPTYSTTTPNPQTRYAYDVDYLLP